jgi:hypothetical protein
MVEKKNSYRNLIGKPEGKMKLERPRCRWNSNIEIVYGSRIGGCEINLFGSWYGPWTLRFFIVILFQLVTLFCLCK